MKKITLTLFLMFMGLGMVFPKGITITSPKGGKIFNPGQTIQIRWIKINNPKMDKNIKIRLLGKNYKFVIVNSFPNENLFIWRIPQNIKTGNNLRIRIKTTDNQFFGDSKEFSITNAAPRKNPRINITFPTAGLSYTSGDYLTVNFIPKNISNTVDMFLLSKSNGVKIIMRKNIAVKNNISNQIQFLIEKSLKQGNYFVRIESMKLYWDSPVIYIRGSYPVMMNKSGLKTNTYTLSNSNTFPNGIVYQEKKWALVKLPDLVIKSINIPESPVPASKKEFIVNVLIQNIGKGPVPESKWFYVTLGNDSVYFASDLNIGFGLKPGEVKLCDFKIYNLSKNKGYRNEYYIKIDRENSVKEKNENNNYKIFKIDIKR